MNEGCARFQDELAAALGDAGELARLARDGHAGACDACAHALARERGLERLLARLPEPVASAGLARRVLAGLAPARLGAADRGETDRGETDERELDALLDALPAPKAPAGLATRVLAGLARERARPRARRAPLVGVLALAAALLAGVALWAWFVERRQAARAPELVQEVPAGSASELEADEELLAYAVERWELLHDDDLDVWLASLDPLDELLMEIGEDEGWLDGAPAGEERER